MSKHVSKFMGRRSNKRRNQVGNVVDKRMPTTVVWNIVSQHIPNVTRNLASDNVVHDVWQTAEVGNLFTSSAGGETNFARGFTINDIQGISSWLAVYDQYKIAEVETWISPVSTTTSIPPGDNFRWLSVVDYDDNVSPSFNALLQYSNVTDCGRYEAVYRRFAPHIVMSAGTSSSSVLGVNSSPKWIDSGQTGVLWYGFKLSMSATSTTVVLTMRLRFHLQFRNNI